MNEKLIVTKIIQALRKRGCWVTKLHGGTLQQSGLPDLLVVYQGRAVFIEVKRPGQAATAIQQHTLDLLQQHGATCGVATTIEEALHILEAIAA